MSAHEKLMPGATGQHPTFPLGLAAPGEQLEVVAVQGNERMQKRMASMGLHPGTRLEAIQNERAGGLVVRIGESRLALGMAMLHKIQVIKVATRG